MSSTYYDKYVPFPEIVSLGLTNLHNEAYYPLIRLAKTCLGLHCKEAVTDELASEIKALCEIMSLETVQGCFSKTFPLLNDEVQQNGLQVFEKRPELLTGKNAKKFLIRILKAADPEMNKKAGWYLNYENDLYAKQIMSLYLAQTAHKEALASSIVQWANRNVSDILMNEICIHSYQETLLREKLNEVVAAINSKGFRQKLSDLIAFADDDLFLKTRMAHVLADAKDLDESFNTLAVLGGKGKGVRAKIRNRINTRLMMWVKQQQYHEINRYDGLQESIVPATIRGLDAPHAIVDKVAREGDFAAARDLFNHEVSSKARQSRYARGHTGPSNRSTTLSGSIALFFASQCAGRRKTPSEMWIMIYESGEGVYMDSIEPSDGIWHEKEIAMPYLESDRCLGAVKVQESPQSTQDEVIFECMDGFVTQKVRDNTFNKDGIAGDVQRFLDVAKDFDAATTNGTKECLIAEIGKRPEFQFSLPRRSPVPLPVVCQEDVEKFRKAEKLYKEKISIFSDEALKKVVPKGLPGKHALYKAWRRQQQALTRLETKEEALDRKCRERSILQDLYAPTSSQRLMSVPQPVLMHQVQATQRNIVVQLTDERLFYAVSHHYGKLFPCPEDGSPHFYGTYNSNKIADYAQYQTSVRDTGITRTLHGAMHAARTALWTLLLGNLCSTPPSNEQRIRSATAAAFHNAGRQDEGVDLWDEESAALAKGYLTETGEIKESIAGIVQAISGKDEPQDDTLFDAVFSKWGTPASSPSLPIERALLHEADTMEIQRRRAILWGKEKFDFSKLSFLNMLVRNTIIDRADMIAFLREAKGFIRHTERDEYKAGIEECTMPLSYLLAILEQKKMVFPILYSLSKKGA